MHSEQHTVYLVTNTVTGKQYVGMSVYPVRFRMLTHATSKGSALFADIQRYGRDAFECEDIGTFTDKDDALEAESQEIIQRGTLRPNGYNRRARGVPDGPGKPGAPGNKNARRTPVVRVSVMGNVLQEFETVSDAARYYGVDRKAIHRALDDPYARAAGHYWRRANNTTPGDKK